MKKLLTAFIATGLAVGAISLIDSVRAAHADALTTGSLSGVVKDKGSGDPTVGATSAEKQYVVEGLNTTDTGFGVLSSNLPNEFIQETEVITGGYNAEFGRATGAIVNVVTKTGSNQFHGSVFGHLQPQALTA